MDSSYQESTWMVCLNCEFEYNIEEILTDDFRTECPMCNSKEFRECDQDGFSLNEIQHYEKEYHFDDPYEKGWN